MTLGVYVFYQIFNYSQYSLKILRQQIYFVIVILTSTMAEILLHDYQDEWGYEYVIGMGDLSGSEISSQIESLIGQPVTLRINSVGGDCYAAIQIVTAIKKHGNVTAQIDGVAFSAAAVIMAACKQVVAASKYCVIMIHNCRMFTDMWGSFTAEDLKKLAEGAGSQMETFDKLMVDLFVEKTGLASSEIEQMLSDETWMTANEAKDLGFVDQITDLEIQAISRKIYDQAFKKAPMRMVAMAGKNLKIKENSDMSLVNELKAQHEENKSMFAQLKEFLGIKAQAEKPQEEQKGEEKQETPVAEEESEPTAEQLKEENRLLKEQLEASNSEKEANIQALNDAKSMMAETKQLLAEVKSNYKPASPSAQFRSSDSKDQPKDRFSHLQNN